MESIKLWEQLWAALYRNGSSAKNQEATKRFWDTLTPTQKEFVSNTIVEKIRLGKFVWYDPIRAIQENLTRMSFQAREPTFLRGDEKGDIVQVKYHGKYLLCYRDTANQYNLEITKDPW